VFDVLSRGLDERRDLLESGKKRLEFGIRRRLVPKQAPKAVVDPFAVEKRRTPPLLE
jgi:hypothetical protein